MILNPILQDATQTPAWTVSGAAEFTQNLFTGSNTKCVHISRYIYTIYIDISTISTRYIYNIYRYTIWLTGTSMNGKNYEVGLDTACAGTTSYVVSGPAPDL